MRRLLMFFLALSLASVCTAQNALVLVNRADLKALDKATVVRELRDKIFVAADVRDLSSTKIPFTLLDALYSPGHYLFIRRGFAAKNESPVLWQDEARVLVRREQPITEWEGGQSPLEKVSLPSREVRPRLTLDDPALDAWLTALGARVNADTLFSYVSTLATYNRYAHWASNDSAAAWIKRKFQSYGYDSVYYAPFTAHSGSTWSRTANNIIAVIPGTDSPDSIVLIGGHMDATSENVNTGAPGADDNGTGSAAVLEAARLLHGQSFHHTLMFVCFNAEEQGLQGSAALAATLSSQNRRVIALLNMDMIGYYDPANLDLWIEGFHNGTSSVWLMNLLWNNCQHYTTLLPYLYPDEGWGSDHESFHTAGFTAVLSIEYEYESYACYHHLCDLPSQVTQSYMRQMALVTIVSGAQLALPVGSGSISGHVTLQNSADASNVFVSIIGGTARDTTDATGAYSFANLLPGTYSLAFSRSGWITDTLAGIVVTAGNPTSGQDVTLQQSAPGSISGTITLSGGLGIVTDAIVYAGNALTSPASAGAFTLTSLSGGTHVVTASLNGYALGSTTVNLADGQNLSGIAITLYPQWDLEASNFGLDNHGTAWGWGTDATTGAHSGTHVWGTVLGASYANCTDYLLEMPAVSLAHLDSARLNFWHWFEIEANGPTRAYDGANVSVAPFGTENWQVIVPDGNYPGNAAGTCNPIQNQAAYEGTGTTWRAASFNLSAYLGQVIRLRFRLGTDQGTVKRGWYLDDLALLGYHHAVAPQAVANLTVTVGDTGMLLNWTATSGAAHYKIYRGTSYAQALSSMTLLNTQDAVTYLDTDALSTAFYVVIATN